MKAYESQRAREAQECAGDAGEPGTASMERKSRGNRDEIDGEKYTNPCQWSTDARNGTRFSAQTQHTSTKPTNPNNMCHQTNTYIISANELTSLNNPKIFLKKKKTLEPNTRNLLLTSRTSQPPTPSISYVVTHSHRHD
jgi:hypothetical protein